MKDFKQTAAGDIDLTSNDIELIDATLQHERDCILTRYGAMKDDLNRGVGIEDYMNDEQPDDLLRKVRQELTKDGMKISSLTKDGTGEITILGYYEADFNS